MSVFFTVSLVYVFVIGFCLAPCWFNVANRFFSRLEKELIFAGVNRCFIVVLDWVFLIALFGPLAGV